MPLMRIDEPVKYVVEFVPPSVNESDYAWDNFQDQVVVHSRLSKLVIDLKARKQDSDDTSISFYPVSLPTVRAPLLKLFEHIQRSNSGPPSASKMKQPPVSESFNVNKKPPLRSLDTINPSPPSRETSQQSLPLLSRPGSREGGKNASVGTPTLPPHAAAIEITSLKEARAIISKLRVQHKQQQQRETAGPLQHDEGGGEELCPEVSLLDATAKRDLDAFNALVTTTKQAVAMESATAKSELTYYEQLLPKAPPKPCTPPFAASTSSSAMGNPDRSFHSLSNQTRSSRLKPSMKPVSKLPSLEKTPTVDKSASNQELSPVKRSKTPPSSSHRPVGKVATAKKSDPQRDGKARANQRKQQPNDPSSAALSDFDDPDPEIDDAPRLPDDLAGMSALDDEDMTL